MHAPSRWDRLGVSSLDHRVLESLPIGIQDIIPIGYGDGTRGPGTSSRANPQASDAPGEGVDEAPQDLCGTGCAVWLGARFLHRKSQAQAARAGSNRA